MKFRTIHNSWEKRDTNFTMELEVPFNTKARIIIDEEEMNSL
jgi:alpha-L-rhamnosidase